MESSWTDYTLFVQTVFKLSQIAGRAVTRMENAAMGEQPLAVNE